jgi:hypothetical protein
MMNLSIKALERAAIPAFNIDHHLAANVATDRCYCREKQERYDDTLRLRAGFDKSGTR